MLRIPLLLEQMIAEGRWPRTSDEANSQNLKSLAEKHRIKMLAPGESSLYLYPPPFSSLGELHRKQPIRFYEGMMAAPWEIEFDSVIEIGDFGLGSDAPILLDYRLNSASPRVIRLQWDSPIEKDESGNWEYNNHWVEAAPDFSTFVEILGL